MGDEAEAVKYRFVMEFDHDGPVKRVPMDVQSVAYLLSALSAVVGINTANETFRIDSIRLEDA